MSIRPPLLAASLGLALALATPLALAQPDPAPAARQSYRIASGPLEQALNQFGQQAGVVLVFPSELVAGKRSPGLAGTFETPLAALQQLLAGTGLVASQQANGSLGLSPGAEQGNGMALPATLIDSTRNPAFSAYDTPGSGTQVSREQLERVPYSSTGDIFKSVPGVTAAGGRNGESLELNIRGLQGSGRVKTLVDGAMQSSSTYNGYAGNRDQLFVDPDLIATIDIDKGPNSGPLGAGAVGGVVNLRTLEGRDVILDPEKGWGLRLRGTYGNNVANSHDICRTVPQTGGTVYSACLERSSGIGRETTSWGSMLLQNNRLATGGITTENRAGSIAAAWRPLDDWEITVAHAMRERGNYKAGSRGARGYDGVGGPQEKNAEVYNTSQVSESYLLKSRWNFLDDHSLDLGYIKYRSRAGEINGTLASQGNLFQRNLSTVETATYTARYHWSPDNDWLDFKGNLWKSDVSRLIGDNRKNSSEVFSYGSELWSDSRLGTPLGELQLSYGGSFSQERSSGRQAAINNPQGQRETTSAFLQARYEPWSWLELQGGLRRDQHRLEHRASSGSVLSAEDAKARHFGDTLPSYGLILKPWDGVQLFARWSEGMRTPSVREAYVNSLTLPNPALKPERSKSFEYGGNLNLRGLLAETDQLGVKLVWFDNDYDDYIARLPSNQPYYYTWQNIEKARYQGYEASLDYDIDWLFLSYGMTRYQDIRYCYAGACQARPPVNDFGGSYVPARQSEHASLGTRLLDRRLVLGVRMTSSSGSQFGGSGAGRYSDTPIWKAYEIYDLFGSYQATRNLNIAISVENLRDRFYVDELSSNMTVVAAPGRTSRLTLTAQF